MGKKPTEWDRSSFILILLLILIPENSIGAGLKSADAVSAIPPPAFEVDPTRSDAQRPARTHQNHYQGPIIDTHAHLYPPQEKDASAASINKKELVAIIQMRKKLGVKGIVFMPTPNDGIRPNQELGVFKRKMIKNLDAAGTRLFCGSNYLTTWLDAAHHSGYSENELQKKLARLSEEIDSGEYSGVGEIGIYHFDKGFRRQHVLKYPPNFEPFIRIVDLVAEKGMWLDIHAEPIDPKGKTYAREVFGGLELLYRRNPHLKLIYSHTAMTNPANARSILLKYPNVIMGIKVETRHERWKNLEPVVNPQGELYQDWAMLFEELPARFMIGTDFHFGREGVNSNKYKKRIVQIRQMLGTLNAEAAHLIAFENARQILNLK